MKIELQRNQKTYTAKAALLSLLFLLLMVPVCSCGEPTALFSLQPRIERVDLPREDGTALIGTSRGNAYTVQMTWGTEAVSATGQVMNLFELKGKGKLLRATWRVRIHDVAEDSVFLLWPRGNSKGIQQYSAMEGWNAWDVTSFVEEMIKSGSEMSIRLQAGDKGGSGEFDLAYSRIDLTMTAEADDAHLIQENDLLDAAFSALPENHWILKQYTELTEAMVTPLWPETGAPYYFGGHSEEKVLHPYYPSQSSKYYKSEKAYLGGFDCNSFIQWAEEKAGYAALPGLEDFVKARAKLCPVSLKNRKDWIRVLLPGDLIAFEHGTYHVGMIIGTPRMYGLTAENAPELEAWLDAPLMIHCGEDPFVYDRFKDYIETLTYRITITPPDGGVTVSLIVDSKQDAPHMRQAPWKKAYGYFEVLGQTMTVFPLKDCHKIAWMQPERK